MWLVVAGWVGAHPPSTTYFVFRPIVWGTFATFPDILLIFAFSELALLVFVGHKAHTILEKWRIFGVFCFLEKKVVLFE